MGEALPEEPAQMRGELLQERAICGAIAGESPHQQVSETRFARDHLLLLPYSRRRCIWLQPQKKFTALASEEIAPEV